MSKRLKTDLPARLDAFGGNSMKTVAAITCMLFVSTYLWADESSSDFERNWPQWRGPMATGVAPYGDPPLEWSESKNIRWKVEIPGMGHATPIVWGEMIFVLGAIKTDKAGEPKKVQQEEEPASRGRRRMRIQKPTNVYEFVTLAIDRRNGKTLWRQTACEEVPHEGSHRDGSMASNSPVTDGEHVYSYFGSRGLYCYDMKGKLIWKKDLGDMSKVMSFGEGSSPVLHGKTIVVNWDHEGQSFIVALDKNTGKQLWKEDRDEGTSWATPLVVEHKGTKQLITSATNRIRSYDLATGKVIWETGGMTRNVIPCPVEEDGVVYAMSGFRGNALLAIRLDEAMKNIDESKAIAWRHDKDTPYVPSPLLYGDKLYFLKSNNEILTCFDAKTGEACYSGQKLEGMKGVYASPVGAKDRVYIVGRNGFAVVLKLDKKFEVLAGNSLEDSFTSSPAIVGKEMFLRGYKNLYCIAED
jgi:outer membrane protein assembly factor BamB